MNIKRYKGNPILGPEPNCSWGNGQARNPGVIYDGEKFHMIFTAATKDQSDSSLYLGYAQSSDGVNFTRHPEPVLSPTRNEDDFDGATVEDTRITTIDGTHYIAYAARAIVGQKSQNTDSKLFSRPTWSRKFRRVGLMSTKDFKTFDKLGPITSEFLSDANVCLFPEKINGKYAMLHRPSPFVPGNFATFYTPSRMFIAYSDDLLNWFEADDDVVNREVDNDYLLMEPKQDWEALKVGAAGVPIKTDAGWLMMYHAKDRQQVYRCGLLLLDIENPEKVIARTPEPVFEPLTHHEKNGRVKNVVFPCSNILVGTEVYIYYGASDEWINMATVPLKDMLDHVLKFRC